MERSPSPAYDSLEDDYYTDTPPSESGSEGLDSYLEDRSQRQRQLAIALATMAKHIAPERFHEGQPRGTLTSILVDHGRAIKVIDGWTEGSPVACWDSIGMYSPSFRYLCAELERLELVDATLEIPVRVKVGVTLWLLRKSASNRTTREVWQLAQATVSKRRCFHEVIDALFSQSFYGRHVRLATPENIPTDHERYQDPKYKPLLAGCLGAIDGTFVTAHPPASEQMRFQTRKGGLSWNVLAAVDFDGYFTYVLAGWEGPVNDSRVLMAAYAEGFDVPEGHFYLADAGYPSTSKTLVPYRSVRYHLREWSEAADGQPKNPSELYNLRHSSCRNVIERSFGIIKARYPILANGCRYDVETQIRTIYACFALHNFIQTYGREEEDIDIDPEDVEDVDGDDSEDERPARAYEPNDRGKRRMEMKRDRIAERLWLQYREVTGRRSGH